MFDAPAGPRQPRKTPLKSFRSLAHLGRLKGRGEIPTDRKRMLVAAWFAACGPRCGVCGVTMIRVRGHQPVTAPDTATIDHIIARCLGGTNTLPNLRVICHGCNNAKARQESLDLIERKKVWRKRALKAARTRARKAARREARAELTRGLDEAKVRNAVLKVYRRAKASGKSEAEACARARQSRQAREAACPR